MRCSDYQTVQQATKYHQMRFAKGLITVHLDEVRLIKNWLDYHLTKNRPILADIGCGTGRIIKELLIYNPQKIYAVDQSKAMLAQCRKNYSAYIRKGRIKILLAASNNTLIKSGEVDCVISLHLFKHLSEINSTIKEVSRILQKKGLFIFEFPNRNSIIRFNLGSCQAFDQNLVKKILKTAGLKIQDVQNLHPLGETIYNIINLKFHCLARILEKIATIFGLQGTKIFVLAQKI